MERRKKQKISKINIDYTGRHFWGIIRTGHKKAIMSYQSFKTDVKPIYASGDNVVTNEGF